MKLWLMQECVTADWGRKPLLPGAVRLGKGDTKFRKTINDNTVSNYTPNRRAGGCVKTVYP